MLANSQIVDPSNDTAVASLESKALSKIDPLWPLLLRMVGFLYRHVGGDVRALATLTCRTPMSRTSCSPSSPATVFERSLTMRRGSGFGIADSPQSSTRDGWTVADAISCSDLSLSRYREKELVEVAVVSSSPGRPQRSLLVNRTTVPFWCGEEPYKNCISLRAFARGVVYIMPERRTQ
jgi:hypothetical protein